MNWHIPMARGPALEHLAEIYGVSRVSVMEPDRSLRRRSRECWDHWGHYGTALRPAGPEAAWWAPLEWGWWRFIALVRVAFRWSRRG